MTSVPRLGRVHRGFLAGLPELWPQVEAILKDDPFIVTGHSRGAAQATIMTALALLGGKRAARRVVFGEPLSGDAEFCSAVSAVPSISVCNERDGVVDPVVEVPEFVPVIAPYVRTQALTKIPFRESKGNPWKALGPAVMHYMPDYVTSLDAFYKAAG